MANVTTNTRLIAGTRRVVQYVAVDSDGTEETDLVLYDSSAVATALGIVDPLTCTLVSIKAVVNATSAARVELQFDATTDILAMALPAESDIDFNFKDIGGLKNPAGTGITGDITLTTTGLGAGDNIIIILEVRPD